MTIAELVEYYDSATLALQIRYCKAAGRHRDLAMLLEAQRLQTILIIGGSESNETLRHSPQYAEAYEKYCWFRLMLDPPLPRQSKPRKQVQASPRAARPMRRVSKIMESLARKIAAQTNVNTPGAKAPGVFDATQSVENQNASEPGPKGPGVPDATHSIENQKTPAVHDDGESNTHQLRIVKSRNNVGTHVDRRLPSSALRLALMSHLVSLDHDGGTHPVLPPSLKLRRTGSDRAYRRDVGTHPVLPTSLTLRRTGSGREYIQSGCRCYGLHRTHPALSGRASAIPLKTCFATGLGGACLRAA